MPWYIPTFTVPTSIRMVSSTAVRSSIDWKTDNSFSQFINNAQFNSGYFITDSCHRNLDLIIFDRRNCFWWQRHTRSHHWSLPLQHYNHRAIYWYHWFFRSFSMCVLLLTGSLFFHKYVRHHMTWYMPITVDSHRKECIFHKQILSCAI